MKRTSEWLASEGGAWHLHHSELAVTACYMPLPEEPQRREELAKETLANWREEVCWACARVAGIHTG